MLYCVPAWTLRKLPLFVHFNTFGRNEIYLEDIFSVYNLATNINNEFPFKLYNIILY